MKKNLLIFTLILVLLPYLGFGQTYTHQATTTSYGGGQADGGTLKNFVVAGESVVSSSSTGANIFLQAGFIFASDITCPIPVNLSSIVNGQDVTLSWSDTFADSYKVRYRVKGASGWEVLTPLPTSNSATLSSLESGTTYQFRVKSNCGSIASLFSDKAEFVTAGPPACEVPDGITISTIESNPGDVTISWGIVGNAVKYELRYKIKNTQGYTRIETADATTSILLSGLAEGVTYVYSVRSLCSTDGSLVSAYSEKEQFVLTNGAASCETPTNIVTTAIGDNSATISWDAVAFAVRYAYRYRVKGSSSWINNETVNDAALIGLNAGTTYQLRVRSICDENGSLVSDYSSKFKFTTTGVSECIIPSGISVSSISDNSATADWSDAGGALEYEVRYKITGSVGWNILYTTSSTLNLTGLLSGMPYQLKIRSICTPERSFLSAFSNLESFTTTGSSACGVPGNLQSINESTTSVDLSWDDTNGVLQYEVRYKIQGDATWNIVFDTDNQVTLTGLTPNESYRWKVRSICALDNSVRSVFSGKSKFITITSAFLMAPNKSDSSNIIASLQAYPNPFNDRLRIDYYFLNEGFVSIKIYSTMGKEVETIYEGNEVPGAKSYEFLSGDLPAGVYVIKAIDFDGNFQVKRVIMQR